jgi:DNA invertase Pin-like site-specific DNA recombinase
MSRKIDEILVIYGYSRVSTSDQDYKTQIQKLENAGAEKIFSEKYTEQKRRTERIRRITFDRSIR